MKEWIVDGYLDRSEEHEWAEYWMLVETDPWFKQRNRCLVTPATVDVAVKTTTRFRVFNPYAELATVPGDVLMTSMGETELKRVFIIEESPLDQHNYQPAQRVVLEKELPVSSHGRREGCASRPEEPMKMPNTCRCCLYEKVTAKRNKEEWEVINCLLNDFQDVFSKDEYDLGKTYLMEHQIETGDAAPVKLP